LLRVTDGPHAGSEWHLAAGNADKRGSNHPDELLEFTTRSGFVRQFWIDATIDGPFGIAAAKFNGSKAIWPFDNNTLWVWRFAV
jgi:hypothetical protein